MTEAQAPDLTPPTKRTRAPKDPNAPKKERAKRTDYGYHADAVIGLVEGKEIKYRGNRLAWFEAVRSFAGMTVKEFEEAKKNEKDAPRGWVRFFVQDGAVSLTRVQ